MEKSDQNILVPKFCNSVQVQELARLKEAVNRSDEEKFHLLTRLMLEKG